MAAQRDVWLRVWIDGRPLERVRERVLKLEVEERCDAASTFYLSLDMAPTDDGDWDALADGRFALLHRVTIALGTGPLEARQPEIEAVIFDGYITAVEPIFGPSRVPDSSLELYGLDASCLMHFDDRTRAWSDMSDARVVEQIYREYGFGVDVEETAPVRAADRGPLLQRCTDAELIRQLARRNGLEAYVERVPGAVHEGAHPGREVVGHLHPPRLDATAQPPLSLLPRATASLLELRARWESHRPTVVTGAHIDERTRRIRTARVTGPRMRRLGGTSRADILAARLRDLLPTRPGLEAVSIQAVDTPHEGLEVETLARADYRDADWLAEATGVVQGLRYPTILRARRPVEVTGAGRLLDGTWYVRGARHRMVWDARTRRYEVDVSLARNALNGVG